MAVVAVVVLGGLLLCRADSHGAVCCCCRCDICVLLLWQFLTAQLDPKYEPIMMSFSAQTSANQTQASHLPHMATTCLIWQPPA